MFTWGAISFRLTKISKKNKYSGRKSPIVIAAICFCIVRLCFSKKWVLRRSAEKKFTSKVHVAHSILSGKSANWNLCENGHVKRFWWLKQQLGIWGYKSIGFRRLFVVYVAYMYFCCLKVFGMVRLKNLRKNVKEQF